VDPTCESHSRSLSAHPERHPARGGSYKHPRRDPRSDEIHSGFRTPERDHLLTTQTDVSRRGLRRLKIGDLVRYRRRLYWLRGFTPRSVHDERVELQDVRTGEWITAPVDQVKPTRANDSDGA